MFLAKNGIDRRQMCGINRNAVDFGVGATKEVLLLPCHVLVQAAHIGLGITDNPCGLDLHASDHRFDIVLKLFTEPGYLFMLGFDLLETLCKGGLQGAQACINQIFFRVVYGIGVHGHVAHDVAQKREVRLLIVTDELGLIVQQAEQYRHVTVILAKPG